jgi:hypothetical protein
VSKFGSLKTLKPTKARVEHCCSCCGKRISIGAMYYREHVSDVFLHSLHAKKFCGECVEKRGDGLLDAK